MIDTNVANMRIKGKDIYPVFPLLIEAVEKVTCSGKSINSVGATDKQVAKQDRLFEELCSRYHKAEKIYEDIYVEIPIYAMLHEDGDVTNMHWELEDVLEACKNVAYDVSDQNMFKLLKKLCKYHWK